MILRIAMLLLSALFIAVGLYFFGAFSSRPAPEYKYPSQTIYVEYSFAPSKVSINPAEGRDDLDQLRIGTAQYEVELDIIEEVFSDSGIFSTALYENANPKNNWVGDSAVLVPPQLCGEVIITLEYSAETGGLKDLLKAIRCSVE